MRAVWWVLGLLVLLSGVGWSVGGFSRLPGVNEGVGFGYDIVRQDKMGPIFQLTFNSGRTAHFNGTTWSIPDQMYFIDNPATYFLKEVALFNEVNEWLSWTESGWNIKFATVIHGIHLGGAFGRTRGEFDMLFEENTNNVAVTFFRQEFFELGVVMSPMFFSPAFKLEMQMLPKACSTNAEKESYQMFIDTFGTHVIGHALMGGLFNVTTTFKRSIYDHETEKWVATQAHLSIEKNLIHIGYFKNHTDIHISEKFSQVSKTIQQSAGGDGDLLQKMKGFGGWVHSLYGQPALLMHDAGLVFLYQLLPDPTASHCLEQATLAYGTNHSWPRP